MRGLEGRPLPLFFLHVHGPGGIGKTTLMWQYMACCEEEGLPYYSIEGHTLEPTPPAFIYALRQAMALAPETDPAGVLAQAAQVLFIDTYDALLPLDGWLREAFFPRLSDRTLVVLVGRHPPWGPWRSDPGWRSLTRAVALRNLSSSEGRAYLTHRGLPAAEQDRIMRFTHGHPLALSLIADLVQQRPDVIFDVPHAPDVIATLLGLFVQKVPSPAHRTALEACARVRYTTEPLLAAMHKVEASTELFGWLRSLSFIETGPTGLYPHDLAREVLTADVRWRNPEWHQELHQRARRYYLPLLNQHQDVQSVLTDYLFLHRDNPVVQPFFVQLQDHWQTVRTLTEDLATSEDRRALVSMIDKHEGPASAAIASYWLDHEAAHVRVYRADGRQVVCFLLTLEVNLTTRPTLIVLSEDAFADAIKDALRAFTRPDKITQSPLLQSRVVIDQCAPDADTPTRVEALRMLIYEAIASLENTPRSTKYFLAVDRTYIHPAPSQEQAAERLNIPYSTFRRHLQAGIAHITETLWYRETHPAPPPPLQR